MKNLSLRRHIGRLLAVAAATLTAGSCAGELATTGDSPAYLIVDSITAASGAQPGAFGNQLNSDVITLVDATIDGVTVKVPTVFNDSGQVGFRMALKNTGSAAAPTAPSTLNQITITRYRVTFRRADGRNTPGVDVPYGFDGAATVTVGTTLVTMGFELVRHTMKSEPPLMNLANNGGATQINTIAEITFYGRDQAGNEVSVSGLISVNFADFGDPS